MTVAVHTTPPQPLLWDVFCRVVDNLGDIGVCWRLAMNLAARGQRVRLWADDATPLQWMAPGALEGRFPCIQVFSWSQSCHAETLENLPPADVWVETFGCDIAPEYIANYVYSTRAEGTNGITKWPVFLNLEYLTAEGFAQRSHTLPSPIMTGPAAGHTKHFFYPGFTHGTGGLLREADLQSRQQAFDHAAWLSATGIPWHGERLVSLFCYEPPALVDLLKQLAEDATPTRLLVTSGRAAEATKAALFSMKKGHKPSWNMRGKLSISYLPPLTQTDFDHLLWTCDINFVRGEDSLVRALWADKPFVWQIYPQSDDAHHNKLEAFLDMLGANASLRQFHRVWNGVDAGPLSELETADCGPLLALARRQLLGQDDLATQLQQFVSQQR